MLLCSLIISSFTISGFNMSNETTKTVKYLQDLYGKKYVLEETNSSGYAIYDDSNTCVEYSQTATSPYKNFSSNLYYLGPTHYYHKNEGLFYHTISGETKKFEERLTFTQTSKRLNSFSPKIKKQMYTNQFYLHNYKCIRDIKYYAYNNEGTCGYVAAALALYYCYNEYSTNYIDD